MMIKKTTLIVCVVLFLCACMLHKKTEYIIPDNIKGADKVAYTDYLEKGRLLYKETCEKCHNKKSKNLMTLKDFTAENLETYMIRINNKQHAESLTAKQISSDDLNNIINFVLCVKKQ